jgi:hypothetical protein
MELFNKLTADNKLMIKLALGLALVVAISSVAFDKMAGVGIVEKMGSDNSVGYVTDSYMPTEEVSRMMMPIYPPQPGGSYTPGEDAESYEVKEYHVSVETRHLNKSCSLLADLKSKEGVIFENVSENKENCYFTFKVRTEKVAEMLAWLEGLDPESINEQTYTIKREVSYYENEVKILETKLETLDKTLADALAAYDEVVQVARARGDVAGLAQVIDSKLNSVERLTSARLEVVAQLDRLSQSKAESLDRLNYTYFYVNVVENKIVKGDDLVKSWLTSLQTLVVDFNRLLQDLSVGFVGFLFLVAKYALYGTLLIWVGKYAYRFARRVWLMD